MQIYSFVPSLSPYPRGASHRSFSSRMLAAITVVGIVLGFGLLSGCGDAASDAPFETVFNPCEPLVIAAQPGTRPAELASLDAAIAMWNEAADLKLTRDEIADAPRIPVYFEDGASFVHGFYSDESGTVTINHKLSAREHTITAAHELGHAFDLHHVEESTRRSLMNKGNLSTELTAADVDTLHRRWPQCGPTLAP